MGGEEVGDEDIPIAPILIYEDDTETSDVSEISDKPSKHIHEEEDEPEDEDDTIVESVDDEEQQQDEVESVEEEEQQ